MLIIRFLFLFLIANTLVFSATTSNILKQKKIEKLQILARLITTKDDIITATGDILVHSTRYYITAQKVIYNKKKATLELFDNVNIIQDGKNTTYGNYAFLDFSNEVNEFTPVLLLDNKSNVWINSKNAKKQKDIFRFKKATISSCDCYDPVWSLGTTSGDYNTSEQWLNTYNTTLYIKDIPILYTPYFGFSTNQTRRTGLLKPLIGFSTQEGLLYAQPYFYAPAENWDIEYIPQIRTSRGNGHQLKYRYKDSKVSLLEIDTGIFNENSKYYKKSNLINKQHYGIGLKYNRSNVIATKDSQDGLRIDLNSINDVDYINTLYNDNGSKSTAKLTNSNIKYFYNNNKFYADVAFDYYKTLDSSVSNDTIMQELPKIQLHKYSQRTPIKNILYSADIKFSNKTRKTGIKGKSTSISIPLTYTMTLLNDYLNVTFSEVFTMTDIKYGNNTNNYANGQLLENKHIITFSTDLLKTYDKYIHTINFKSTITLPNTLQKKGDLYSINNTYSTLSVFPVNITQKNINFTLNQSWYGKETKTQLLNHKINQSILYDNNNKFKLSDLENEVTLKYKYGKLSNTFLYNHQDKIIISSSTSLSFAYEKFDSSIYYNYSKDTSSVSSSSDSYSYKDLPDTKNITYSFGYKFNNKYKVTYKDEYNLKTNISNKRSYTLDINEKCWAFNIKLQNSLVASATTTSSAIRQNIFYIEVNLKPFLKINQEFIQKKEAQ